MSRDVTVTFGFPNSKKNSFRGNYMRKYGSFAVCKYIANQVTDEKNMGVELSYFKFFPRF
jgi:hypothetical protein